MDSAITGSGCCCCHQKVAALVWRRRRENILFSYTLGKKWEFGNAHKKSKQINKIHTVWCLHRCLFFFPGPTFFPWMLRFNRLSCLCDAVFNVKTHAFSVFFAKRQHLSTNFQFHLFWYDHWIIWTYKHVGLWCGNNWNWKISLTYLAPKELQLTDMCVLFAKKMQVYFMTFK